MSNGPLLRCRGGDELQCGLLDADWNITGDAWHYSGSRWTKNNAASIMSKKYLTMEGAMKQINEAIKTYLEACEHEKELSPHTVKA